MKSRFGSWNAAVEAAGFNPRRPGEQATRKNPSTGELLTEINRLADGDEPPTTHEMNAEGRYSSGIYVDRFDSWNEAVKAAGFDPRPGRPRGGPIPDEALLYDVRCGAAVLGVSPSHDDYKDFGTHSTRTLRLRFGSWDEVLKAADLPPTHRNADLNLEDLEVPSYYLDEPAEVDTNE
ncbi:homing endonuclease associated repeat-containing protein [Saliphagus sp. GCM10025308]